jgi:hypothetical protein
MRNLSTKGLSMSQAQSISNLCNQRAQEISRSLATVNNASREINVDGTKYLETEGVPMPANVIDLILEKAKLHACQGFLMDALKSKEATLNAIGNTVLIYDVEQPEHHNVDGFEYEHHVNEEWGWEQLSNAEYNEYLEKDSLAAHVGQFIHRGGKLDNLRDELPKLAGLDWISVKTGEKTPVKVTKHHTSEQLLTLHEQLAGMHRELEQRVNYFKAKVKNLVTEENARRAASNALRQEGYNKQQSIIDDEWRLAMVAWRDAKQVAVQQFEEQRERDIKEAAALRINVDPRFQEVVDMFLVKSED